MLIRKRKIKALLFFLAGIAVVSFTVRAIVQSQLNKEIIYFKRLFAEKKDGLDSMYNPLDIKQIPEEVIDELYKVRLQESTKKGGKEIDWSKYAYVAYATHANYLCNALMLFHSLKEYGTQAKLVLLLSKDLVDPEIYDNLDAVNSMLTILRSIGEDQVVIKFVDAITKPTDTTQWSFSLSKLQIFNQTEFDRIIYMDNDAILNGNLDELFFLPEYVQFAAPITYWELGQDDIQGAYREVKNQEKLPINLARHTERIIPRIRENKVIYNHLPSLPPNLYLDTANVAQDIIRSEFSFSSMFDHHIMGKPSKTKFAANLMVIKPSQQTFERIQDYLIPKYLKRKEKYDMDLINEDLYNMKKLIRKQFNYFRRIRTNFVPEVLVLPFGRYDVLTGSIRKEHHQFMLKNDILGYKRLDSGGKEYPKNMLQVLGDAKYIHFSDFPIKKPWEYSSFDDIECTVDTSKSKTIEEDERVCDAWNNVYQTYMYSREICFAQRQ